MIRQASSCDICGAEKRQTNHWFVAYEHSGELRVSEWASRHRLRPGSKHLCGQTCLHKLVDEFVAKTIALRNQRGSDAGEAQAEAPKRSDTSLAAQGFAEVESSARLITPPAPAAPTPAYRALPEIVPMPQRPAGDLPALPADTLRYASRRWHAEAWERERERELRSQEARHEIGARRRSGA